MNDEIAADLIRVGLLDILQWVAIDENRVGGTLTPFQRSVRDLAKKYGVPSPYDTDVVLTPIPVPEGKIKNG